MAREFAILNTQAIEKSQHRADGHLQVKSVFNTIQGEGPFTGRPAVFIRLAGCNLQCPGCDTDYTDTNGDVFVAGPNTLLDMVREMRGSGSLVVITGGEPFRQNITPLAFVLAKAGYFVQVETNGTLPPPEGFYSRACVILGETQESPLWNMRVFVVVSPKAGKVNAKTAERACAYKYVMQADSVSAQDGLPIEALHHTASPVVARPPEGFKGMVYLQPMDEQDERANARNVQAVVDSCMKFGYTLQLQIHKIIEME
jgi:organic radical activating enzyme